MASYFFVIREIYKGYYEKTTHVLGGLKGACEESKTIIETFDNFVGANLGLEMSITHVL